MSILSEFEIEHPGKGHLFLSRALNHQFDPIAFSFYFDYVVYFVGEEEAKKIVSFIKEMAEESLEGIITNNDPCSCLQNKSISESEVAIQGNSPKLISQVKLEQDVNGQIKASINLKGNIEENKDGMPLPTKQSKQILVADLEPLFLNILLETEEDMQRDFIILTISQCSWYEQHGAPNEISELGIAPNAALMYIEKNNTINKSAVL